MRKAIHDNYNLHDMELSEYTRLFPEMTRINTCIMYIDECASFARWKHPLWVIVSYGDPYVDPWIALSISEHPEVISVNNGSNLDSMHSMIKECKSFISKFHQILFDIALENVDSEIMYDILSKWNWESLTDNDICGFQGKLYSEYNINSNRMPNKPLVKKLDLGDGRYIENDKIKYEVSEDVKANYLTWDELWGGVENDIEKIQMYGQEQNDIDK